MRHKMDQLLGLGAFEDGLSNSIWIIPGTLGFGVVLEKNGVNLYFLTGLYYLEF